MSYRKLTVDNKEYEYTVGKTHTKVKGGAVYLNSEIGDQVGDTEQYIVTPFNVANAIKGIKQPRVILECRHGTQTHETVADPYSSEIDNKYVPIINCAKCVHDSYMDT